MLDTEFQVNRNWLCEKERESIHKELYYPWRNKNIQEIVTCIKELRGLKYLGQVLKIADPFKKN